MSVASYKKALDKAVADLVVVNRDRARLAQRAKYLEETIAGLRALIDSTDVIILNPSSRSPEGAGWPAASTPASTGMRTDLREVVVRALTDARALHRPDTEELVAECRRAARRFTMTRQAP